MTEQISLALVFAAGITSVLSPCVLPVLPIVVTGGGNDHKLRPLLVVAGISSMFMLMGVISSLFGAAVGSKMVVVEKVAAVVIMIFGTLLIANVNLFKYLSFLSGFAGRSRGVMGGYFLGATLGIIWIPCVGPLLSSVLAIVATEGKIGHGVFLLAVYSAGFAVPMLAAGYASQWFRSKITASVKHPYAVSFISGLLLVGLGAFIFTRGMIGFGR